MARGTLLGMAALFAAMLPAAAQDYPAKPVRIIVAFSPGASTDILARAVAQRFTEVFGHTAIVENRAAGAGGTVGTAFVAKAPADGYTLLMANNSTHTVAPHLYKNAGYDALRDFAPVSLVGWISLVLVTHPSLPVKDVKGLIAFARSHPGQLFFSSSGTGTSIHLAGELFRSMAKIDIVHVPYKGAGAGVIDLVGGQVQLSFVSIPTGLPFIRNNRLRALGVTTLKRTALYPDVPTIAEAALPGYDMSNWVGLVAPAQTPPDIVTRLNAEIARWMLLPDTQQKMLALGVDAGGGSAASFAETIARGHALMGKTIQASGIRID
jgi:tripartite-type tricarboxylate transporter receptor subunit TctC